MVLTPPHLTELAFDVTRRVVVADGEAKQITRRPRAFELLLLLAIEGGARSPRELAPLISGRPHHDEAARDLRELRREGLISEPKPGHFQLNATRVFPGRALLARTLEEVRQRADARLFGTATPLVLLDEVAQAQAQADNQRAARLLSRRVGDVSLLAAIERYRAPGPLRAATLLRAYVLAAQVNMGLANLKAARTLLARAEAWANRLGPDADYWRVRLFATAAGVHRMAAALGGASSARHYLEKSRSAFGHAARLARRAHAEPEIRAFVTRWVVAEGVTPLIVHLAARIAETGESEFASKSRVASDCLRAFDVAETLLGQSADDGSGVLATRLLRARSLMALGYDRANIPGGIKLVEEAERFRFAYTPRWVLGWLHRSRATFAWDFLQDAELTKEHLLGAWNDTPGSAFQRLHILARFAAWGIEPLSTGQLTTDRDTDLSRFVSGWHLNLVGVVAERCGCSPVRRRTLLPILDCMFRDSLGSRATIRGRHLGLWT